LVQAVVTAGFNHGKGLTGKRPLGTSGKGGEPKKVIPTCLLVHSPTSVLMFARGLQKAAIVDGGEGREEQ
jgi:hypothetical protein